MNIPVTPFMWIMAFMPIIVLLVLMIGFNWPAWKAAITGLVVTIASSLTLYKADVSLLLVEGGRGAWSAMPILLVILTAILMYQVSREAGAFSVIRNGMRKLLPNELLLVLAMGWIFESFLQGITGFGVPVAVGAPLLIGLGVKPMWAVIIPLLGQSWGNTFGTLAAAWDALAMSAELQAGSPEYMQTAFWTAFFIMLWNAVIGFAICWFYGKGRALKKGFFVVLIMTVIQGGGELLLSQINTTLACFVPACISLIVILLLGRTKLYGKEWSVPDSGIMDRSPLEGEGEGSSSDMTLIQAFVPYFLLSAIALVVLLIKPVNAFLGQFAIGIPFPETQTGYGHVNAASESFAPLKIFTHASMFLLIASMTGLVYYKKHGWIQEGGAKNVFIKSLLMARNSTLAVLGLVVMSRLMSGTGQTVVLANGIVAVLGNAYVVLAPFVGLLGTFMTGSNMSSNILFGNFQQTTASLLHVESSYILGAQSSGASVGSSISPSNIAFGTTTANISGSEGQIMKKILCVAIPMVLVIGVLVYILVG